MENTIFMMVTFFKQGVAQAERLTETIESKVIIEKSRGEVSLM